MRAVHVKMTVATVLLGSYLVASKLILREVPVFTATFVRLVSAVLVLAVYVRLRPPAPGGRTRPGRRDSAVLFAQTLLGVFLFSVFAMYGVKFTGAIEAGVLLGMVPISISLVAIVFLGERLGGRRGLGIALAVLGAVSINVMSGGGRTAGAHAALGVLLLVCSVLCEAVFVTFGKLLRTPIAPARLSLIISTAGALMFLVPAGVESHWGAALAGVSWRTWALMVYTGVAINGIAVVLMYDSLDSLDTTVVAAFTALTPVSGAVLSVLLLGERLHAYHLVGMALVIGGVFVVAKEKPAESKGSADPGDPEGRGDPKGRGETGEHEDPEGSGEPGEPVRSHPAYSGNAVS
ncbi:DMT family transporter [Streptomyces sp. G-G2]|uniref:DMT family transporter n=1 Tax=Streptomyces sp. G-G2 TaxID=3046201 RepID=UPI0024B92684|nr:DMT family transporter [Streptomyces sp. G-G2]MDJ0382824.1 DMT family transporter [Streptomyces sp. G-G2]